jgi:hypothetical protein
VLHRIIQDFVAYGSTIHTDSWKGYIGLNAMGYVHKTVNHSVEFVSSEGVHTQNIESTWRALKGFHLPRSGCRKHFYYSYFMEYSYRKRYFGVNNGENMDLFWKHVSINYNLGPTMELPIYDVESNEDEVDEGKDAFEII